jgi:hypothetical protein
MTESQMDCGLERIEAHHALPIGAEIGFSAAGVGAIGVDHRAGRTVVLTGTSYIAAIPQFSSDHWESHDGFSILFVAEWRSFLCNASFFCRSCDCAG